MLLGLMKRRVLMWCDLTLGVIWGSWDADFDLVSECWFHAFDSA